MKVLFLDIDGVVNGADTHTLVDNLWPIDRYMAFLVGKIVLDTGCKVVLSSSWRHHPDGVEVASKRITPIHDITGNGGKVRGDEIKEWLDAHPEVTEYAIVDDDSDMLEEQKPNFFQTSWSTGITEEIAKQITKHFNG